MTPLSDSVTLNLHLFEEDPNHPETTEQDSWYKARTVTTSLHVKTEKHLGFTLYGLPKALHCLFQIVPEPVTGEKRDLDCSHREFIVPIHLQAIPTWMAVFNFHSYVGIVIPINEDSGECKLEERVSRQRCTQAEINAEHEEMKLTKHLIFIDLVPRKRTPPKRNLDFGSLIAHGLRHSA